MEKKFVFNTLSDDTDTDTACFCDGVIYIIENDSYAGKE